MKALQSVITGLVAAITIKSANAEPVPFGCYVTDTERNMYQQPPTCYQSSDGTFSWLTPANTSDQGLVDAYGALAATFIKLGYDVGISALQCDAAYKSQVALVKRLRRACGSKCRRIK